jgi:hypothetical protein
MAPEKPYFGEENCVALSISSFLDTNSKRVDEVDKKLSAIWELAGKSMSAEHIAKILFSSAPPLHEALAEFANALDAWRKAAKDCPEQEVKPEFKAVQGYIEDVLEHFSRIDTDFLRIVSEILSDAATQVAEILEKLDDAADALKYIDAEALKVSENKIKRRRS